MDFKQKYTKEELEQLFDWFAEHREQLPETLVYDKAVTIPHLADSLRLFEGVLRTFGTLPSYRGMVFMCFRIKEMLEAQWAATQ